MNLPSSVSCAVIAVISAVFASGCYAYSDPAYAEAPVVSEPVAVAPAPAYYEGNVVYYDAGGAPFVYVGREVRYVPGGYRHREEHRHHEEVVVRHPARHVEHASYRAPRRVEHGRYRR